MLKIAPLVRYLFVIKIQEEEEDGKRLLFHFSRSGYDENGENIALVL